MINQYKFYCSAYLFSVVFFLSTVQFANGQTCSCAGAPLISSQSISTASKGNLLLGMTHQYNEISKLYSGSTELINRSVTRNTQSSLLEINYGITNRLTFSGTATFVQKFRKTGLQNPGNEEILKTRGIGDGLLMLKYVLHQNTIREQYQIALGTGVKIPFGSSSLTQNGLALNADMQPGTGAWDGVIWSYFSKTFAPATTINLFWYNTFRRTGENERFGADDKYRFGNELVSTLGITDKLLNNLSYIFTVRYRSTASDQRNDEILPNTGGKWVNLQPGFSYSLTDQLSIRLSGQLPVYQHLKGIQPTTSYTASLSLFYNLGKRVIF